MNTPFDHWTWVLKKNRKQWGLVNEYNKKMSLDKQHRILFGNKEEQFWFIPTQQEFFESWMIK